MGLRRPVSGFERGGRWPLQDKAREGRMISNGKRDPESVLRLGYPLMNLRTALARTAEQKKSLVQKQLSQGTGVLNKEKTSGTGETCTVRCEVAR